MSVNNKGKSTVVNKDPYKRVRNIHGEKIMLKKGTARSLTLLPQIDINSTDMLTHISKMIRTLRMSRLDVAAERGARFALLRSFDLIKTDAIDQLTDLCAILEKVALMEHNVNRARLRGQGPPNSVLQLKLDDEQSLDVLPIIIPELNNEMYDISVESSNDTSPEIIDVEDFSPDPEPVRAQESQTIEVPLVLNKTIIMPKISQSGLINHLAHLNHLEPSYTDNEVYEFNMNLATEYVERENFQYQFSFSKQ